MFISIILQVDNMSYYGICEISEEQRIDMEQTCIDSASRGIDDNRIVLENVKFVRMDREPKRHIEEGDEEQEQ